MRARGALAMMLGLTGCVGAPPVVLKGDDSFVTVSQPTHSSKSASREVASDYCQKLNKRAVFLSDACPEATCVERTVTYWCQ